MRHEVEDSYAMVENNKIKWLGKQFLGGIYQFLLKHPVIFLGIPSFFVDYFNFDILSYVDINKMLKYLTKKSGVTNWCR